MPVGPPKITVPENADGSSRVDPAPTTGFDIPWTVKAGDHALVSFPSDTLAHSVSVPYPL